MEAQEKARYVILWFLYNTVFAHIIAVMIPEMKESQTVFEIAMWELWKLIHYNIRKDFNP